MRPAPRKHFIHLFRKPLRNSNLFSQTKKKLMNKRLKVESHRITHYTLTDEKLYRELMFDVNFILGFFRQKSLKVYVRWYICTVRRKILHTLSSVWSKTTLTTGNVGGAGLNPQT